MNTEAARDTLSITLGKVTPSGLAMLTVKMCDRTLAVDKLDIAKPKARAIFVESLCTDFPSIDEAGKENLTGQLLVLAAQVAGASSSGEAANGSQNNQPDTESLLADMPEQERRAAEVMLDDPNLIQLVVDDIAALGVAGECTLTATIYLVGVSRILARPLAAIVQGPTSSGKSYVAEKVADLFPPESIIRATAMTPQALYHLPVGALEHRFIVAGERNRRQDDETAEATKALREMLSSGRLTKMIPEKDGTGTIVTHTIEQSGPIAFVETTTLSKIFDEDANRCLLLQTDERAEQTRRILKASAIAYAGNGRIGLAEKTVIIQRHWALQRMLKPLIVVIPFAERLADLMPSDRVEARRAFTHTLSLIEAVTLLHQCQRQTDVNGRLIAEEADYTIALHLLRTPMLRALGGRVSDAAMRFYRDRIALLPQNDFDTKQARESATVSDEAVRGYLRELYDAGTIELVEESRGRKPARWRRTETDPEKVGNAGLPPVEKLFFQQREVTALEQTKKPLKQSTKAGT